MSITALGEVRGRSREHRVASAMGPDSQIHSCASYWNPPILFCLFVSLILFLGGNYYILEMSRKEWQVNMGEQNCIGERGKRKITERRKVKIRQ